MEGLRICSKRAYFSEIYRGGIESIPAGQYEAAKVLGYGKTQTFVKIILPQVIKRILPSVTNEVITLVKDTSLAFSIAYAEMFSQAKALAASQKSMIPFVAAAIFYYVFNYVVAFIMEFFEKKEPNRLHRITEWAVDCAVNKIIRGLNNELKEKGYRVISGKVPTKYFEEKFYGMAVG